MKCISLFLILFVALLIIGCASQQYVPKEDEELYGIWTNKEYPLYKPLHDIHNPLGYVQKIDCSPAGTMKTSNLTHKPSQFRSFAYVIADKWNDSDGNIYYKQTWIEYFEFGGKRQEQGKFYLLCKVSNSVNNVEFVSSTTDYPEQIDPKHKDYRIYYRQM